ncbi:hypothetical protein D3C72_787310 [compost metagenome]
MKLSKLVSILIFPGSAKNKILLSNEFVTPLSKYKYSISGDSNLMSLSKAEFPSILILSIATSEVSTTLWIYKVPVFKPLMFPVMCKLSAAVSFLLQDANTARVTKAINVFFIGF